MKESKSPVLLFVILGVIAIIVVAGVFLSRSTSTDNPLAVPTPSPSLSVEPSIKPSSTPLPSGLPSSNLGDTASPEDMKQWITENESNLKTLATLHEETQKTLAASTSPQEYALLPKKFLEMKAAVDIMKETVPDGTMKVLLENLSISLGTMVELTQTYSDEATNTLDGNLSEEQRKIAAGKLADAYLKMQKAYPLTVENLMRVIEKIQTYIN